MQDCTLSILMSWGIRQTMNDEAQTPFHSLDKSHSLPTCKDWYTDLTQELHIASTAVGLGPFSYLKHMHFDMEHPFNVG